MKRTIFISHLISVIFSVINFILCLLFWSRVLALLNNTAKDYTQQYEFLTEVLCGSYIRLIWTASAFDIGYYLLYAFFTFWMCKETSDANTDNVRTKALKENKLNNLMIELLFVVLIKGISLGFGFFYILEGIWEAKRIIEDTTNPQTDTQLSILSGIVTLLTFMKWIICFTILFVLWFYFIRFFKILCKKKEKRVIYRSNSAEEIIAKTDASPVKDGNHGEYKESNFINEEKLD